MPVRTTCRREGCQPKRTLLSCDPYTVAVYLLPYHTPFCLAALLVLIRPAQPPSPGLGGCSSGLALLIRAPSASPRRGRCPRPCRSGVGCDQRRRVAVLQYSPSIGYGGNRYTLPRPSHPRGHWLRSPSNSPRHRLRSLGMFPSHGPWEKPCRSTHTRTQGTQTSASPHSSYRPLSAHRHYLLILPT